MMLLLQYLFVRIDLAVKATVTGIIPALQQYPLVVPQGPITKRCEAANIFREFFDFILGNINGLVQSYAIWFILGLLGILVFLAATKLVRTVVGVIATAFVVFLLFMILVQNPPMFNNAAC